MKPREMQIVWAAARLYDGGIDGVLGRKSQEAVEGARREYGGWYTFKDGGIDRERIASVQACLNALGHDAGTVDGYEGHNTREALNSLLYKLASGKKEVINRVPQNTHHIVRHDIPLQSEVSKFYGDPECIHAHLKTIEFPFEFRIDWNLSQRTNKITVHEKCADSLEKALTEVYEHYGVWKWKLLGLDRYAGAYNKRKMRGGNAWSMHAYGCAIDFYAQQNGLRTRCPDALFCKEEYKPFLDIMESNGWLSALRLWGADAMHFQAARL